MTNREQIAWALGFDDYDARNVTEIVADMMDAIGVFMDSDEQKRLEKWLNLSCDEDNNWGVLPDEYEES